MALNTQVIIGHHPSVNPINALVKMGMVFPDAITRTPSLISSLFGSPAILSDLATTTAPLSVVTWCDLSLICLSEFRLSQVLWVMMRCEGWHWSLLLHVIYLFPGSWSISIQEVLMGIQLVAVSPKMAYVPTLPAYGSPRPDVPGLCRLWF